MTLVGEAQRSAARKTGAVGVLPEGTLTFLFTDIEGSTRLIDYLGSAVWADCLAAHHGLIRAAVAEHDGLEVNTDGDAFFVVFTDASAALAAALDAQESLAAHPWPERAPLRVRMGIHTGEARLGGDNYVGIAVHQAARICAAGHGGEVLCSAATATAVSASDAHVTLRPLGRHRLPDLSSPIDLLQVCPQGVITDFPPPRSLERLAHTLPCQPSTFVGRALELGQLHALLDRTRLLTITGPGGCGKTRLGYEVAARRVDDYADGLWVAELAAISDSALVPSAVLGGLGLREEVGRQPIETIIDYLRAKVALLVLDNCEHVIDAAAELTVSVLSSCPQVRFLTTSREPLRTPGEMTWRVPPLSKADAVDLFVARASAAEQRFDPSSTDLRTVAELCEHLDGLPLAIELAAARVSSLAPSQIVQRLEDRFVLLGGQSRAVTSRHRTLHALVDWSHDLLGEAERIVFRRLSVFPGDFGSDGAEQTCSGGGIAPVEALVHVGSLVDKSLVVAVDDAGGTRYRMPETIALYAKAKLDDAGEARDARTQHLLWCLQFAECAEAELHGNEQPRWFAAVDREQDSLRAAIAFGLDSQQSEISLRIAGALSYFWLTRGHWREGCDWLRRTLEQSTVHSGAQARALCGLASLRFYLGALVEARGLYRQAREVARDVGEMRWAAAGVNGIGRVALEERDLATARACFEESLAMRRELGGKREIANSLHSLARVTHLQGDTARAEALFEESLAMRREIDDDSGIG